MGNGYTGIFIGTTQGNNLLGVNILRGLLCKDKVPGVTGNSLGLIGI